MKEEEKELFDKYYAATIQGILANEQCCPFSFGFEPEEVALKAARVAIEMMKIRTEDV